MSSFDTLVSGDLMGAAIQSYTTGFLAPFEPLFYGLMMLAIMGVIYMKTENLLMIGTLGFLMSTITISGSTIFALDIFPQAAIAPAIVIMAVSFFIVIYKVVKK